MDRRSLIKKTGIAGRVDRNFKLAARHFLDGLGEHFGRAEDGVQGLGET